MDVGRGYFVTGGFHLAGAGVTLMVVDRSFVGSGGQCG